MPDNGDEKRARIRAALAALLRRENRDSFVIFQEGTTEKFVQFVVQDGQDLFLDLPSQTLDQAEDQRAESYFREFGVQAEEYDLLDAPGGNVAGRQRSYQMLLGQDIEAATDHTLRIFDRVYLFPAGFELVIQEN